LAQNLSHQDSCHNYIIDRFSELNHRHIYQQINNKVKIKDVTPQSLRYIAVVLLYDVIFDIVYYIWSHKVVHRNVWRVIHPQWSLYCK